MRAMSFSAAAGNTYEVSMAAAANDFEKALSAIDPGVSVRVQKCDDRPSFLKIVASGADGLNACLKHLKSSGIHANMSPGLTLADAVSLNEDTGEIFVRSGPDFTTEYAQALLAAGSKSAHSSKPAVVEARVA